MSQNNVKLVVCTLCVHNRDWIFLGECGECFMSNHSIQSTCGLWHTPESGVKSQGNIQSPFLNHYCVGTWFCLSLGNFPFAK